jgi:hypothetical protein
MISLASFRISLIVEFFEISFLIPKNLEYTRDAFPSIAAMGSKKEMEAIAAAVYGPIPGSLRRLENVSGKISLYSSWMILAHL